MNTRILFFFLLSTCCACNSNPENNSETKSVAKPEIEWVEIPAGSFMQGSPESEPERMHDEKQHRVEIDAFKMSKYEITFAQYDLYCDASGKTKPDDKGFGRGNRPVINVAWEDADAFAKWMNCRLPTESEWEYACRAGTITPFYTGNNLTTSQANFNGTSYNTSVHGENRKKTMPVGSFPPNPWGLYDMHGNVSEWCCDHYTDNPVEYLTKPTGSVTVALYVIRGGNFYASAMGCRSAARNYSVADKGISGIGIRLVSKI